MGHKKASDPTDRLPKDANGNVIKKGGRVKGTPNKITAECKEIIARGFEDFQYKPKGAKAFLKGYPAFVAWIKENPTVFLTQLYAKLLPVQVSGQVNVDVRNTEDPIQVLYAAYLNRVNAADAARRISGPAPVIDVRAETGSPMEMVLVEPSGTKAA